MCFNIKAYNKKEKMLYDVISLNFKEDKAIIGFGCLQRLIDISDQTYSFQIGINKYGFIYTVIKKITIKFNKIKEFFYGFNRNSKTIANRS